MVYCEKFKDLEGCGKCTINLSDSSSIRELTPISMTEVVDSIFSFCINNCDKRIVLHISTIDCKGNINILYTQSRNKDCSRKNKTTCKQLINLWYHHNKIILCEAVALIYLSKVSYILGSVNSDNEIEKQAGQLSEIMDQLLD